MTQKEQLSQAYQLLELAKFKIQELLVTNEEQDLTGPGIPGGKAWEEAGVVWCVLPDCPPITKDTGYQLLRETKRRWGAWVAHALDEANIKMRYQHAVVVIRIYSPTTKTWDTDNRSVNAIVNAIRLSGLVRDDSWEYLSYMVTGRKFDGPPCTEVAVVERSFWESFKGVLEAPKQP